MRIKTAIVALLVYSFLWSAPATAAQGHIADPAVMRQAIVEQAAADQENREAVRGVLNSEPARELAARLGLTVARADTALATLGSAELAQLASTARVANLQLAGGANNTIIISTTTVLLIVIIVILVAR